MFRDYRLYLDDIIEAIRRIKEFTDNMTSTHSRKTLKHSMRLLETWRLSEKLQVGYLKKYVNQLQELSGGK